MTDIVSGIRKEVGPDYPIVIRLCADELLHDRGGNTTDESLQTLLLAEEAGADCLSVTAGWQESAETVISRDRAMGSWLYLARRVREATASPDTSIAMAYRLFVPTHPEQAIAEGYLDFWESCRAMIADPFLPTKILEGREDEIIPCMACNICLARLFRDAELNCMVRPSLGHESEPEWGFLGFPKTEHPKKVWVVGAGIAGMQAAAIAAEKGHEVTVTDRADHVGGQSATASKGPWGDEEFIRLVRYLEGRCNRAGVTFELGRAVTNEEVDAGDADSVIVATGAVPKSDLPGADLDHVVSCLDVLDGEVEAGETVAILGSKGVAIAMALYLVHKGGHRITLIHRGKKPGLDVNPSYIWRYITKLREGGVVLERFARPKEVTPAGVLLEEEDGDRLVEADTVILADMHAVDELAADRKGKGRHGIYLIGDALLPRRGNAALLDGYKLGMRL